MRIKYYRDYQRSLKKYHKLNAIVGDPALFQKEYDELLTLGARIANYEKRKNPGKDGKIYRVDGLFIN